MFKYLNISFDQYIFIINNVLDLYNDPLNDSLLALI